MRKVKWWRWGFLIVREKWDPGMPGAGYKTHWINLLKKMAEEVWWEPIKKQDMEKTIKYLINLPRNCLEEYVKKEWITIMESIMITWLLDKVRWFDVLMDLFNRCFWTPKETKEETKINININWILNDIQNWKIKIEDAYSIKKLTNL